MPVVWCQNTKRKYEEKTWVFSGYALVMYGCQLDCLNLSQSEGDICQKKREISWWSDCAREQGKTEGTLVGRARASRGTLGWPARPKPMPGTLASHRPERERDGQMPPSPYNPPTPPAPTHKPLIPLTHREPLRKKYGIFWEFFPNVGPPPSPPIWEASVQKRI